MKFFGLLLGFSTVFLNSCQKELEPKNLVKEQVNVNLQGSVELKKGISFSGFKFDQFIGYWEVAEVRTATLTLDVPKTINGSFVANIQADGNIQWLREEKPKFAFCDADNMKLFSRDEKLIIGYQDVLFDQDDKLVEKPSEKYILIDFDVEGESLLKLRGEVPQGIAVIPELGYTIKPGDTVDYVLKKIADFNPEAVVETQLNRDLCDRKLTALGLKEKPSETKNPDSDKVVDDEELPLPAVDRNDFIQKKLKLAHFELNKGKMSGELSALVESEEPKAKNVKFSGSKDKAFEAVFHFALENQNIDGLQIELAAKKGKWGQYEPKLELSVFNVETSTWKLVDGSELFYKGATLSNDLFKDISNYIVEEKGKKVIKLKLSSDLNRLDQCKFFKLLPCTIQPSILVDYISVSSLKNPYRIEENPLCPRKFFKGIWEVDQVSAVAQPDNVVILDPKNGVDNLSKGKTVFKVLQNFSAGSGRNKKLQVYVKARDHTTGQQGWNYCPDKRYNFKLDYEKCTIEMDPVREGMKNSLYNVEVIEQGDETYLEMKMIYATENAFIRMRLAPEIKKAPKPKFKFDCIR